MNTSIDRRKWSLATRLTILMLTLAIVPVMGVTAMYQLTTRSELIDAIRRQSALRAAGTADVLDNFLSGALAGIQLIALEPDAVAFLLNQSNADDATLAHQELAQAASILGYDGIYLTNQQGQVVLASFNQLVGRNYITAPWFRNAISGQAMVDEPRYDPLDGQVYLHIAVPVRAPTKVIIGCAVGRITLARLDQIIQADTNFAGRGAYGILWNEWGVRLSDGSNPALRFQPLVTLEPAVMAELVWEERYGPDTAQRLQQADQWENVVARSRSLQFQPDADPHLSLRGPAGLMHVVITPLRQKRWSYGIFTPIAAQLAEVNNQLLNSLLLAATAAFIASGAAVLAARWLSRPLTVIAETATAIAAGDRERRVRLQRTDELGRLATAFDAMADAVQDKEQQLLHYAQSLEQLIEERTATLRASEAELRAVFAAMQETIATLDTEGRLVKIAPTASSLFQASAVGQPISAFFPDHADKVNDIIQRVLRSGETGHLELQTNFQGKPYWFDLTFSPMSEGRILLAMRDVTESKQLEQQFLQAQKMETVGRLAGGVAHDFNNLLTAIIGYATMALRGVPADHKVRPDIEGILSASQRASNLTHQLLAFSRRQILEQRVINLNQLITDMQKMLGRLIREDIQLTTHLEPHLASVKVDIGQIEQVILNLAVNARDAMPNGGRLTIETHNVTLDANFVSSHPGARSGDFVVLTVSDTGVGMDEETRSHLFEPFYTTKPHGQGTGLGLATVYGIVKQHGGYIYIDSEVGKGTICRVYLPKFEEPAELISSRAGGDETPIGTETILLVEDEAPLRSLAERILRVLGYTVLSAANGEEGLRIATQYAGAIDLLLTDVVMPQMGGKELADRLIIQRPHMEIIFMSGHTESSIVDHGILSPGITFLQKPFTVEALARKVREVLDRQKEANGQRTTNEAA